MSETFHSSAEVINYYCAIVSGFTFTREEGEAIKFAIDGAIHDGWKRPDTSEKKEENNG